MMNWNNINNIKMLLSGSNSEDAGFSPSHADFFFQYEEAVDSSHKTNGRKINGTLSETRK